MKDELTDDQIREALGASCEEVADAPTPAAVFIPNDGIEMLDLEGDEPGAATDVAIEPTPGALGAYNFSRDSAETGQWFPWPKFGPKARIRIAFIGCRRFQEAMRQARRRYGKKLEEDPDLLRRFIPTAYAQTIFTGLEEVSLFRCVDTPTYSVAREGALIRLVVKQAGKVFDFEALAGDERPENYLADTELNRLRLLLAFQPEFEDEIFGIASKRSHFRDASILETVRGN